MNHTEGQLMELIDLYCHENWLKVTAAGEPEQLTTNPVSFAGFIKWMDARRRERVKEEDDRQKEISLRLGGTIG